MNGSFPGVRDCLFENGFVPINNESYSAIKRFNADNLLYETTECLIITWSDEYQTLYRIIDGILCIANFYPDGEFSFIINFPCAVTAQSGRGSNLQHVLDTLYDISIKAGLDTLSIREMEERFLEDYRQVKGYRMEARYNNDMSEYVYSADSLLGLRGKANEEKRRQLRKFVDKPNVSLREITKENFNLCLEMEKKWCSLHDCDLCHSFVGCSKKTAEIMADIFDGSVYQGVLGYIDDVPAGYVIFEKVSEENAYFYFAKSTVSNFSVYLYYASVQRYLSTVKRINLGADVGKPGLRLFKKRLGVHDLQKKYFCTFIRA